jgi:hypothetical protein
MGVYLRGKSWYIDFYYEGKRYTEKVGQVAKSVAEKKLDIKRSEVIRGGGQILEGAKGEGSDTDRRGRNQAPGDGETYNEVTTP